MPLKPIESRFVDIRRRFKEKSLDAKKADKKELDNFSQRRIEQINRTKRPEPKLLSTLEKLDRLLENPHLTDARKRVVNNLKNSITRELYFLKEASKNRDLSQKRANIMRAETERVKRMTMKERNFIVETGRSIQIPQIRELLETHFTNLNKIIDDPKRYLKVLEETKKLVFALKEDIRTQPDISTHEIISFYNLPELLKSVSKGYSFKKTMGLIGQLDAIQKKFFNAKMQDRKPNISKNISMAFTLISNGADPNITFKGVRIGDLVKDEKLKKFLNSY